MQTNKKARQQRALERLYNNKPQFALNLKTTDKDKVKKTSNVYDHTILSVSEITLSLAITGLLVALQLIIRQVIK